MAALPKITQYAKNVVKSISYSAVEVTKNSMPTLAAYVDHDGNKELARSIYAGVKDYKSTVNKAKTAVKSSRLYESADLAIKSSLEDLKTGKFYNKERIDAIDQKTQEALFGSWDDMDLDLSFSDEDGTSDITTGDRLVAASNQVASMRSAELIAQTQIRSTDAIIKSNKASTQAIYTQNAHILGSLKEVAYVGSQTQGALVHLNETQKISAENSKKFYESTSKLLQDNNGILKEMLEMQRALYSNQQNANNSKKEKPATYGDIVSYDGTMDFKGYLGNVKNNAKNVLSKKTGGVLDLLLGGDANMLNMFAASPLSFMSTMMLEQLIPKNVSSASKNLDKTLAGLSSTILARLNNMSKNEDNPLAQMFGSIFGINTNAKSTLDPSKYNKGAVPFDGIVRKSIVDVIPTYLRRIEAVLSGKPERVFDPAKGTWTTVRQIKDEYDQIHKSSKYNANYDLVEEFQKVLSGKNSPKFDNKYSRDDFNKSLETFLDKLYERDGDYKFKSKEDSYDFGIRQDHFDQIIDIFTNKNNKSMRRARINTARNTMSSKNDLTNRFNMLEEYADSPLFQLFNNSTDSANFKTPDYESPAAFSGALNLASQNDKLGHNIFYYLQNMYKELYSIRTNYGLNELSPAGMGGSSASTFTIPDSHRSTPKELFYARENDARRRYDEGIDKHVKNNGRLYGYDTKTNIIKDRNTVEYLNANKQLEYNSKGWLNDALYGDSTSLTRLNSNREKTGFSKIEGKNFLDKMKLTKTLSEKLAVMQDQVNAITKAPARQVTKLLEKADARIYDFFYGAETGEEDEQGNKITGFMQLMSMRLNLAFDKVTDFIDAKLFNPIKQKLGVENMKDLMDKMGVTKVWDSINTKLFGDKDDNGKRKGGIFGETREEIKKVFSGAKDYVLESIKDVFSPITNKIKEAWANKPKVFSKNIDQSQVTEEMLSMLASQEAAASNSNTVNTSMTSQLMLPAVINNATMNKAMRLAKAKYSKSVSGGTINMPGPVESAQAQTFGGGVMFEVRDILSKIYNLASQVVYNKSVRVHVAPKKYTTGSTSPRIFSHASMRRESETEGDSTGESDGELHSSAFGNHFRKKSTSALSEGELYGKNGLFSKVPKTGVYDVQSGTTIYPTNKNKTIELANEQSSISKFLGNITTNANANNATTKIVDGKVYSLGEDSKWHNYSRGAKGGIVDRVLENGFLDQMYSAAKGGIGNTLSGLGFNGLANSKAVDNIDSAMETVKKYAPKMTANGLLGAAIGLLSGNPLLGAAIGASKGYIDSSEKAKTALFGNVTKDEEGNEYRSGGIISKQTQDTFKKYLPSVGKYGVTGAALGLLTPFGLVGGSMLGSAIGWATSNDRIKESLFGNLKDAKSGLISKDLRDKVKKAAPNIAVGTLATILGGPFGLFGNMIVGTGIGYLSTTDGFKDAIFGKEGIDEDGNKSRKGGLVGALKVNVVDPLKDFANTFKTKAEDFIIKDMINPLKEGIVPITREMGLLAKGMVGFVPKMLSKMFESTFGRPLQDVLRDTVISPMAKLGGGIGRVGGGVAKTVISAPFKAIGGIGRGLQSKHIRSGNADYISAQERLSFRDNNKGRGMLSNIPGLGNSVFGSLGFNPTGYRDKYKDIDTTLASIENPESLKSIMDSMNSISRGKGFYQTENRKTGRSLMSELTARFPLSVTGRMQRALKNNDLKTLSSLIRSSKTIDKTKLSTQEAEGLIQKAAEALKTIDENGRKSNLSGEQKKIMFGQLNNLGFKNLNEKNIGKVRNMVQSEYELKKYSNEKTPEQKQAEKTKDNAKLVSDPITENADKNAKSIIDSFTEAINRLAEIQLASLPPGKAKKLLNKQHAKTTAQGVDNLTEAGTEDGEDLGSTDKQKWIFDSAAGQIRKYVKTGDGWNEASGKAKADADKSLKDNQEHSAMSLAGGIGGKLKDLLGIGVDKETGEKKSNPILDILKKTAKFLGVGVLGATAIAGAGHGSQFVKDHIFPGIRSVWNDDVKPFFKEHLGSLYDKVATFATDAKEYIVGAPKRIVDTASTIGDWMTGSGQYKGSGLPWVFENKIFPWYLEGFDKFATIYFPPLVKAFTAVLPSLAKGLVKGVVSGIGAILNPKDKDTTPDFDTDYSISGSDVSVYSNSSSALNKINPVSGGSGWWKKSGSGLGDLFKKSGTESSKITTGRTWTERNDFNDSNQANVLNSKGSDRAQYVAQGIENAKEVLPDGSIRYNPKYMPKNKNGNSYLPDGSLSNDNSRNLFNPLDGAVSMQDRAGKYLTRKLVGGGGRANVFSLLENAGKITTKMPVGIGKVLSVPTGLTMQGLGKLGNGIDKIIPDASKFIYGNANVGTTAKSIGTKLAGSKNAAISKLGTNLVDSGVSRAGVEAAKTSVDKAAAKGIKNAAKETASSSLLGKVETLIRDGIKDLFSSKAVIAAAKEGMEAVGKETTEKVAKEVLEQTGEKLIKRLVRVAGEKLAKAGAKLLAKVTSAVGSAGISLVLFAAWDFTSGMVKARDILGLTENQDIGVFERFLAGLLKCVNGFLTMGLIPEDLLVDIFIEYLAPLFKLDVEDIKKRREAAKSDVETYNAKNGSSYSVVEYNNRNSVWNKIKNAFKDTDEKLKSSKDTTYTGSFVRGQMPIKKSNGMGKYGLGRVSQNDPLYSGIPFNKGNDTIRQTIGNSGCGPAAAVNAVNYAYGTGRSLEEAANMALSGGYKEKNGGTNPAFFKSYFNKNGLNANSLNSNSDILNSIQNGSPVVLMGKDPIGANTPYGPNPHYVVGKGVDSKGNIIIDDPESMYGTSKYNASKVLNRTSVAISASKYGRNKMVDDIKANMTGESPMISALKTSKSTTSSAISKATSTSFKAVTLTDKEKYTIAFSCLPVVDKPFSSIEKDSIAGPINSALVKVNKTLTVSDKSKTVRTILSNYLGIRMGEIQDFVNAIAKVTALSLGDLKGTNSGLYTKLKDICKAVSGLDITSFNRKTVGEIAGTIGVTFAGDAPNNVTTSAATPENDWTGGGIEADMSSYGDAPVKENIFDKIGGLVKSFFSFTDKDGNKRSLLDAFGFGDSSSTSESQSGSAQGMSNQQQLIKTAMNSIMGKNDYSQANRNRVSASLEGAPRGSGDCSSTTQWALRKAGIDPGGDTGSQLTSSKGQWIDGAYKFGDNAKPDINKLSLGDLMFYGSSGSKKANNVSHVEMYWGDGKRVGHGSGVGPRISPYDAKSSSQQYLGSKRFITVGGSVSQSISNIAGSTVEENKKIIWNYLKGKGYSDIAAAGIMGNIGQECAFKHDAIQNNGKGPGIGICQWTYPARKNAFLAAVPNWQQNLGGQLDFMYNEINTSYKSVLPPGLNLCKTVEEATAKFHNVYEGSADKVLTKRYAFANNTYSQFASSAMASLDKKAYNSKPIQTSGFINTLSGLGKYGLANNIVRGGSISSGFNDPTRSNHKGIDIAANKGNPVISAANGTVIRSEYNDTNGNMVVVQSNDGNLHTYAHLDSKKVNVGDRVAIGSLIGTVGSTGKSFGDHVHYQVTNKDGQYVDPLNARSSNNINNTTNNVVRPIGGGDGIDYTQLIRIIIELLGTISDNTAKFTAALNAISEKTGVDLSGIDTSSKDKGISKIRDRLKALDSSSGGGRDMGSSMMGRGTGYLVEVMSAIAKS